MTVTDLAELAQQPLVQLVQVWLATILIVMMKMQVLMRQLIGTVEAVPLDSPLSSPRQRYKILGAVGAEGPRPRRFSNSRVAVWHSFHSAQRRAHPPTLDAAYDSTATECLFSFSERKRQRRAERRVQQQERQRQAEARREAWFPNKVKRTHLSSSDGSGATAPSGGPRSLTGTSESRYSLPRDLNLRLQVPNRVIGFLRGS